MHLHICLLVAINAQVGGCPGQCLDFWATNQVGDRWLGDSGQQPTRRHFLDDLVSGDTFWSTGRRMCERLTMWSLWRSW